MLSVADTLDPGLFTSHQISMVIIKMTGRLLGCLYLYSKSSFVNQIGYPRVRPSHPSNSDPSVHIMRPFNPPLRQDTFCATCAYTHSNVRPFTANWRTNLASVKVGRLVLEFLLVAPVLPPQCTVASCRCHLRCRRDGAIS